MLSTKGTNLHPNEPPPSPSTHTNQSIYKSHIKQCACFMMTVTRDLPQIVRVIITDCGDQAGEKKGAKWQDKHTALPPFVFVRFFIPLAYPRTDRDRLNWDEKSKTKKKKNTLTHRFYALSNGSSHLKSGRGRISLDGLSYKFPTQCHNLFNLFFFLRGEQERKEESSSNGGLEGYPFAFSKEFAGSMVGR